MNDVVEVTLFLKQPEVDEPGLVQLATEAAAVLQTAPGFLSRVLSRDGDGHWTDIVEWESMAEALHAEAEFADHPAIKAFSAAMQPGAVLLRREVTDAEMASARRPSPASPDRRPAA
jgi:hypothetical protein